MHPAGHVGDIWCRMWRYLSWTPPPTDSKYLTMRWWPWWRHHLRVRQVPRAPFMAWLPEHCGVDRVGVLYASATSWTRGCRAAAPAPAPTDAAGAHCRRRGRVFHWWCHGQLVGVLLPRRRLVLGAVQKVAHRHARGGWERRITLRACGAITYRQHAAARGAGGATFCWANGEPEEDILETWSLEPPFSVVERRRAAVG